MAFMAWGRSWPWAGHSQSWWVFALSSSLELLSLGGRSTETNKKQTNRKNQRSMSAHSLSLSLGLVVSICSHCCWTSITSAGVLHCSYLCSSSLSGRIIQCSGMKVCCARRNREEWNRQVKNNKRILARIGHHLFNDRNPWPHLNCTRSDSAILLNPVQDDCTCSHRQPQYKHLVNTNTHQWWSEQQPWPLHRTAGTACHNW